MSTPLLVLGVHPDAGQGLSGPVVVLDANEAAVALLGLERPALLGGSWVAGLAPWVREELTLAVRGVVVSGGRRETSFPGPDATTWQLTLSHLGDPSSPSVLAEVRTVAVGDVGDVEAQVSHELRTPTTSLLGYAEVLRAGDCGRLTHRQHEVARRMERNGQRLLLAVEMVEQVLRRHTCHSAHPAGAGAGAGPESGPAPV